MGKIAKSESIRGWLLLYVIFGLISGIKFIILGFIMLEGETFSSILSFGNLIFGAIWVYTISQIILRKKKAIDMTIYLLWMGIIIAITGEQRKLNLRTRGNA